MSLLSSVIAHVLLAQVTATAPVAGRPVIFSGSPAENGEKLEIVRIDFRPATRPATATTTVSRARTIHPDFVETYEAHTVGANGIERVLWRYERNWYAQFSSDRMRYRVLSAAVIDKYLFIVEKMTLGTSILRIRIGATPQAAKPAGFKHLLADSEVDGPIVVSAAIRQGSTWGRSTVVLNHDQAAKYRREFTLGECFGQQ